MLLRLQKGRAFKYGLTAPKDDGVAVARTLIDRGTVSFYNNKATGEQSLELFVRQDDVVLVIRGPIRPVAAHAPGHVIFIWH